jgi:hypothetical protein
VRKKWEAHSQWATDLPEAAWALVPRGSAWPIQCAHHASSDDKLPETVHNVGMTVRRLKTYAGAQGYVYQYYFVGQRAALADDPEAPATEFVFDVTSDRKLTYAVSVFLPEKAVAAWAARHGRRLTEAEQYAAAKLRLFGAFDELEDVKTDGRRLTIDVPALEEALASLGVD